MSTEEVQAPYRYLRINLVTREVTKTNDYSKVDFETRHEYYIVIDLHKGVILDSSIEGSKIGVAK